MSGPLQTAIITPPWHVRLITQSFQYPWCLREMNPEPGFQPGPGDSVDADSMAPCLLVTKSSPPSGGAQKSAVRQKCSIEPIENKLLF